MVHTGYNAILVVLSIAIAVLASHTALDLGARVRGAAPGSRWAWICAAALAMGGGIWSMHFVGMLAFEMAMPVAYEAGLTVLSFVIAVGGTGAAFAWVSRRNARATDVLLSGPLMGVAVAAMHYVGMAAMRIPGNLAYSPPVVALSVLIAVTAATAALWLTFRENNVWQTSLAAGLMGLAVAGMHYTGMKAATFTEAMRAVGPDRSDGAALGLGQQNLALYVAGATFVILFLGMFASALDQQRIQRDLHASEERFRAAAEAVGDIIWTADAKGEMCGPQPDWRRFSGQTLVEYQGHGWTEAIHPEDVQPTRKAWGEAVSSQRTFAVEHRARRQDGVFRIFSVRAVPILNRDGTTREWVGVHEDITERRAFETALKDARDAAEQANQAKSQFLANMSHELRTPLSAIIGYSEMLQEEMAEGADPGGLASDMHKIEGNARHLLSLINDVLDLSKIEADRMETYAEDFDVARFARDAVATVDALVRRKSNTLVLDLADDLGAMHSDVVKLRQCVFNLLSNAAKFTENGRIVLRVRRETDEGLDWLAFVVEDTGIGMDPDQLQRLFQRFTQADESTTRRFGGTGLGLALSRAFSRLLGGDVTVVSEEGRGTTFTLRVPAELPQQNPDPRGTAVPVQTVLDHLAEPDRHGDGSRLAV